MGDKIGLGSSLSKTNKINQFADVVFADFAALQAYVAASLVKKEGDFFFVKNAGGKYDLHVLDADESTLTKVGSNVTDYVGAGCVYATKEDIPASLRHEFLETTDIGADGQSWRLDGGILDSHWIKYIIGGEVRAQYVAITNLLTATQDWLKNNSNWGVKSNLSVTNPPTQLLPGSRITNAANYLYEVTNDGVIRHRVSQAIISTSIHVVGEALTTGQTLTISITDDDGNVNDDVEQLNIKVLAKKVASGTTHYDYDIINIYLPIKIYMTSRAFFVEWDEDSSVTPPIINLLDRADDSIVTPIEINKPIDMRSNGTSYFFNVWN